MTKLEKTYDPKQIEDQWYNYWESRGYFKPTGQGPNYCIMIPPPNVTGSLHMGHGFQYSLMDALIRYHRMRGFNTLWQVGTDHAGIATQMLVERQLATEGTDRLKLGREKFLQRVYQWKETSGQRITQQMRRMGISVDWTRERFTMDEGLSRAVQEVFVQLYEQGLIYRGQRLVNWDPVLGTAISDLEVAAEEVNGSLWHLRYPLVDGTGHIVVATTRPETMFGDVAVAIHPTDTRHQHLIGKKVRLPLTERDIPIIADEFVDPAFGSGCVKITPAHDFNDYQVGLRHQLPMINVLTPDAHMNDKVPAAFQNLTREAARQKVVETLQAQDLIEAITPHRATVPRGDRSGTVIEPYLTDQWYVKVTPLTEKAIAVVEQNQIQFVPDNWKNTYFQWMYNIQDWCISRQLWWGHRIPAWYDHAGQVYVGHSEKEIRERYQLAANINLRQDEDVLDTWFSSALWPFSTLGWPDNTAELATFYPTQVLVTGFDIIFFWVARMIMMGLHFPKKIPFEKVYITGLIRDHEGQKMSKSKGNILDPLDLIDGIDLESLVKKRTESLMQPQMAQRIEKITRQQFPQGIMAFGADALRFTFCALASTGRDVRFDMGRIEGYRNFCNKIWNAARYVLMNTEPHKDTLLNAAAPASYSVVDRWIKTRLQQLITEVHQHFTEYRFDLLANALYEFTWNEYCDWYLELSKPILMGDADETQKRGTRLTLVQVLETLLRLMHPLMPFLTEEIWQRVAPLAGSKGDTLMLQTYPEADATSIDEAAVADVQWIKDVVVGIRTIRSEMNISPSQHLTVYFQGNDNQDRARLEKYNTFLKTLARLEQTHRLTTTDIAPLSATALAGQMKLLIPMKDFINVDTELQRLQKEIGKLEQEQEKVAMRLANPTYIEKAPAHVVEKEQQRLGEIKIALEKLHGQKEQLAAMG